MQKILPKFAFAVIGLIYGIPAIIIGAVGIGSGLMNVFSRGDISGLLTVGPMILLALLLYLVAAYLIPIAIMRYVVSGSFGDAFSFGEIFKKVLNAEYFISWLIMLVYSLVVIAILGLVPIVGVSIGAFVAGISFFTVIGTIYNNI